MTRLFSGEHRKCARCQIYFWRSEFHGVNLGGAPLPGYRLPVTGFFEAVNGALPPRLITALNRQIDVFGPNIGTWNYTVDNANYQVLLSHYNSNLIN